MENLNIQFKDGGDNIYPVTNLDNIVLSNVSPITNPNINILEGTNVNGLTMTQFINRAYSSPDRLTFLHISDTHNGTTGMNAMASLANSSSDIDFLINTGDFVNTGFTTFVGVSSNKPKLGVWGNHDIYDTYSKDVSAAATAMRNLMSANDVHYGSNSASYWYKDFTTSEGTVVRVIGLDEWEGVTSSSSIYHAYYTTTQIEWLVNLLKDTPSTYYIIIATHQAVEQNFSSVTGEFKSSTAASGDTGAKGNGVTIIPAIIDAYQKKTSITINRDNVNTTADFTSTTPATFLMYILGHKHYDCCEYLVYYSNQLQLVAPKGAASASGGGDLSFEDADYAFNKVIVDFNMRQIRIQRIGAQELKNNAGYRIRTDFFF